MMNPEPNAWHSLLPAFDQGDLHIRPLTSSYDLAREAYQKRTGPNSAMKKLITLSGILYG